VPAAGELFLDVRAARLAAVEAVLGAVPEEIDGVALSAEMIRRWPAMDMKDSARPALARATDLLERPVRGIERGGASDASHLAAGAPLLAIDGLGPLGVEHVAQKGFVCRGVLLDAVALRGGQLPIPKENDPKDPGIVTADDVKEMVKKQGLDPISTGDCVFLYTGHGNIWDPKNWDSFSAEEKAKRVKQFNAGEPGFGISACEYMAEQKIILTGGDTWATEAVGKGAGGENVQPFECHIKLQTKRGIWNLENLDFSQLIADKAYEFLFVWSPLKMKGATGSPGNPVALY